VATAVYLLNRILNKQSSIITAHELVFREVSKLEHLKIFGCPAILHVPPVKRTVWDAKGQECIFVGYNADCRNYRFYDPSINGILVARNATFMEDVSEPSHVPIQIISQTIPESGDDEEGKDWYSDAEEEMEDENDEEEDEGDEEEPEDDEKDNDSDASTIPVSPDPTSIPHVNPPSSSPTLGTVKVCVKTAAGDFVAEVPSDRPSTINLRVRKSLKKPQRFTYLASLETEIDPVAFMTLGGKGKPCAARAHQPPSHLHPNLNGNVESESVLEPKSYKQAIASTQRQLWEQAVTEELDSHSESGTWILVPRPKAVKVLDNRWVFKVKRNPDKSIERFKARLVVRGFMQQHGVDFDETFSQTCRYESIRALLALAAAKGYFILQSDVKTAFLHSELTETIYMELPEGLRTTEEDLVCLLKKSLYGLRQSPRYWNQTSTNFLRRFHFTPTVSDNCVFVSMSNDGPVYLPLVVDDTLAISPSEALARRILKCIGEEFQISSHQPSKFVGIEIVRNSDGSINIHQESFVDELFQRFNMTDAKTLSVPLQPNELLPASGENPSRIPFRQLIGALIFLSSDSS